MSKYFIVLSRRVIIINIRDLFEKKKTPLDIEHELFFGNRKYSSFLPEKVNGVTLYGRKEARVNMARLYMYVKGYSLEDIFSNKPEINKKKREIGNEFYSLVTSKRLEEIALIYAAMITKLSKEKLPNLMSERDLTQNYYKFIFLVHSFKDIAELMDYEPDGKGLSIKFKIKEQLLDTGVKEYSEASEKIKKEDRYGVSENYDIITDEAYIKSSNERQQKIEEGIENRKQRILEYQKKYNAYADAKISYSKMERIYSQEIQDISENEKKAKILKKRQENDLILRARLVKSAIRDSETAINMVESVLRVMSYGFAEGLVFDKVWEMNEKVNSCEENLEKNLTKIEQLIGPIIAEPWEEGTTRLRDIKEFKSSKLEKEPERKAEDEILEELNFKGITKISEPIDRPERVLEMNRLERKL